MQGKMGHRQTWIHDIVLCILALAHVIKAQAPLPQDVTWACSDQRPAELTIPGQFRSPPDPDTGTGYPSHSHCSWLLDAPKGQVVRLEFTLFDLEPTYPCVYSNVTLHDGYQAITNDQIDMYCGSGQRPVVHSSGHQLLVTFKSGNTGRGEGIRATFDFIPVTDKACSTQQPMEINWNIGGLVSPGFPSSYPGDQHCVWRISSTQEVRLVFDKWVLRTPCQEANVSIYNGPAAKPEDLIGSYCGDDVVVPAGTTGSSLLVDFKSSSRGPSNSGFRARFKSHNVTEWACGPSKPAEIDWSPGFIISPTTDDSKCRWRFRAPIGSVVRLEIEYFSLPNCSNCGCAGLQFFDGENDQAPEIGKFCGSGWQTNFILSGGNTAYLLYSSYKLEPYPGFKIRYSFYDIAEHACGEGRPITLTEHTGLLTSPGYGLPTGYPSSVDCQWQILAKETQVIRIDFLDFGIEYCPGCVCDRLSVYNGDSPKASLVRHYCDFVRPLPITTTVNSTFLRFTTDRDKSARGFKLQYHFDTLADLACGFSRPTTMNLEPGFVHSPNFGPGLYYPPHSDCEWLISAPPGKVIELSFQHMDIEFGYYCEFDYLSIYDGMSTNARLLRRVCGRDLPTYNVTSTGSIMMLAFTSNGALEHTGFKVTYIFKPKGSSSVVSLVTAVICGVLGSLGLIILLMVCFKVPQRIKHRFRRRHHEVREDTTLPPPYSLHDQNQTVDGLASNAEISCPPGFGSGRDQYTRIAAYPPPTYEESFLDSPQSPQPMMQGGSDQPPGYEETPIETSTQPPQETSLSQTTSHIQPEAGQPHHANTSRRHSRANSRSSMELQELSLVSLAGAAALVTDGMSGYTAHQRQVSPRVTSNPPASHVAGGSEAGLGSQTSLMGSEVNGVNINPGVTNPAYSSSEDNIHDQSQRQHAAANSNPNKRQGAGKKHKSTDDIANRKRARHVAAILQGRRGIDGAKYHKDRGSIHKSLSKSEPDMLESLGYKSKMANKEGLSVEEDTELMNISKGKPDTNLKRISGGNLSRQYAASLSSIQFLGKDKESLDESLQSRSPSHSGILRLPHDPTDAVV